MLKSSANIYKDIKDRRKNNTKHKNMSVVSFKLVNFWVYVNAHLCSRETTCTHLLFFPFYNSWVISLVSTQLSFVITVLFCNIFFVHNSRTLNNRSGQQVVVVLLSRLFSEFGNLDTQRLAIM